MRIAGAEGACLVGPLDPFDRQLLALKEMRGLVEILLAEDLEAQIAASALPDFFSTMQ